MGPLRTCCVCNKEFFKQIGHIYHRKVKGKTHNYCSYTCYNKEQPPEKPLKK